MDPEALMYLAAGLAASVLLHASTVGVIALFDHWDWSLRADFSWEVDDAELRQVGLGPAPKSAAADMTPSEQKTKQQSETQTDDPAEPEPSPGEQPESNTGRPEQAAVDDSPTDDTVDSSPDPDPDSSDPPEPSGATDTSSTSEATDDSKTTTSDSDNTVGFDAETLGRDGPANLPRLDKFAPGNARYTALIRLDRLRGTPYEAQLGKLVTALPDYRLLAASTDLEPIEQLDTLFFASARPRYLQYTFIAIRHRLSNTAVQRAVDARYPDPPAWQSRRQMTMRRLVPTGYDLRDPRQIILADNGLTLISRPEWIERLSQVLVGSERPPAETSDSESLADGDTPAGSLIGGLRRIEQVAADGQTIVLMSAYGGTPRLPGVGRIRGFNGVRLEVADPQQPTLNIDVHFDSPDAARAFTANFPTIRRTLVDAIPLGSWLDLDSYVTRLEARRTDNFVQIRGTYSPKDVERLAGLFGQFVPRPPALDSLPTPTPPDPQQIEQPDTQKDAGATGSARDTSTRDMPPNDPASSNTTQPDTDLPGTRKPGAP
jgi:hypothetical protein